MPVQFKEGLADHQAIFDFDNTITDVDILDSIIEKFSIDDRWVSYEADWRAGRIGSKECLARQFESVRISQDELLDYISGIKIDPSFPGVLEFFREEGANPVIASDNFSFIVRSILENNGVKPPNIFANSLEFDGDRIIPLFPYQDKVCLYCANCKTRHLARYSSQGKKIIYIGDGLSDACAAQNASLVFAKDNLLKYLADKDTNCVAFKDLGDIQQYFMEANYGTKG